MPIRFEGMSYKLLLLLDEKTVLLDGVDNAIISNSGRISLLF
jgi:hypothetical protein